MEKVITKGDLRVLFAKIERVLGSEEELDFSIVYAMTKTKRGIKSIVEEIDEMLSLCAKEERKLVAKYCEKDKDGKPRIVNDRYIGLEHGVCPDYDIEVEKIIAKRNDYLRENITVDIHTIKKENFPKKGKALILETLCYFECED